MRFGSQQIDFLRSQLKSTKVTVLGLALVLGGVSTLKTNLQGQTATSQDPAHKDNSRVNNIGFRQPDEPYKCVGDSYVYVAPDGRDNATGTQADPFKSVLAAAKSFQGKGGVVYLREGTYWLESVNKTWDNDWETQGASILLEQGGTPNNYLQICNFPGENPVIDGSRLPENVHSIQIHYANNVRIAGLEIANGKGRGIVSLASKNVEIVNNQVRDHWLNGITVKGSMGNQPQVNRARDSVIRDNIVINNFLRNSGANTGQGLHGQGIQARNAENITIANNQIEHNYGEGLGCVSVNRCLVSNNSIINNYSVNLYLDNANSSQFQNNFIAATGLPEMRWHDKRDTNNIQIANENYKNLGHTPEFYTNHLTLQNNLIVGGNMGISYQVYSGAHDQGEAKFRGLKNTLIERNTFHQNATAIFFREDSNSQNNIFRKNIISNPQRTAVSANNSIAAMQFEQNLWYQADPGNTANDSDIYSDPQYVNSEIASPDDYQFKKSSLATKLGVGACQSDRNCQIGILK